jgi:hypothetical protein
MQTAQPGGRIYILDPATDTWFIKAIDKVAKLFEPEHVMFNSSDEFKRLMISTGLNYKGFEIILAHQKVQIGEK